MPVDPVMVDLRPFKKMDAVLVIWKATLPHFLSRKGNDRRGIADQRVEQRVEQRAIGTTLGVGLRIAIEARSEEHTSELQSLMRISYAVFCLKKKKINEH